MYSRFNRNPSNFHPCSRPLRIPELSCSATRSGESGWNSSCRSPQLSKHASRSFTGADGLISAARYLFRCCSLLSADSSALRGQYRQALSTWQWIPDQQFHDASIYGLLPPSTSALKDSVHGQPLLGTFLSQ